MQSDHNDKYEPHEESEYHFSDDEVTYEAEPEAAKPAAAAPARESVLKQFTQRRLIISGIIFLVLVFAVYKMVSPSSTGPSTQFTAPPAVPAVAQNATPAVQPQPAVAPAMPVMPANAITQPQTAQTVPQQPAPVVQQQPVMAVTQPVQQPVQQVVAPQQTIQQPAAEQPPVISYAQSPAPAPIASMPGVIPVETTITTPGNNALPATTDQTLSVKANQLSAQTEANYEQKFNEFSQLTQALQGQVQTLNSRVSAMQSQLDQIVQVLTQHSANSPSSSSNNVTAPLSPNVEVQQQAMAAPPQVAEPHVPYNVQAIIPGRAWLKSGNGETLTVAEGDLLRNVGRVVKIDPYDGVVEINTGNRIVSLSYGNAS